MRYSLKIGLVKALKYIVIFALPILVDQFVVAFPQFAQLTVGGILVMLTNYLKIKAQQ
jgi:hypothetical protein